MKAVRADFGKRAATLLKKLRPRLDSPNPRDRVSAIRRLAAGVAALEREVLQDAQASGMTWNEIGAVYEVSRQAAHHRFSDITVVSSEFFDWLLEDDDEPEGNERLAQAFESARRAGLIP